MLSFTKHPSVNQLKIFLTPKANKKIVIHQDEQLPTSKKLVAKILVKRSPKRFFTAYAQCLNQALREAKKRGAKEVWVKVINYPFLARPKTKSFLRDCSRDNAVKMKVMFFED